MSPEQLIGAAPSVWSDLYAAGVVLHECLRGTTPFEAETRLTFIAHKLDTPAPGARRDSLQPQTVQNDLEAIVARLMAATPEARPQSASAVLDALMAID
jgi:serine/threonine protein kinase